MQKRVRYELILLGILAGLLSLEILVRLYSAFVQPKSAHIVAPNVADTRLGWHPTPKYPGIDARGWRNALAIDRAAVVALGDSMTYGNGVAVEAAWPQQLGQMLHRSVYQMADGGYGPGHYLLLFDDAAALRPKVLIATYYLGNDDLDAYSLAYHTGVFRGTSPDPLLDSLVSTDPRIGESTRRAESIDPAMFRLDYLRCVPWLRRAIPDAHLQQVHDILTAPPLVPLVNSVGQAEKSSPLLTKIDAFLQRSMTYRTTRQAIGHVVSRADYGPPICIHFHDERLRTVFNAADQLILFDRTDPRVVEGERISLSAFRLLAERSRDARIRFYVLLIPTKESAFRAQAKASLRNEPIPPDWRYLRDVWSAEATARSNALGFFKQVGIDVIDALPALEAVLESGVNPYRENWDIHPIPLGYKTIAGAVAERLRRDAFGGSP